MIRSTRPADTHAYLVDSDNPRSRNTLKFYSALGVIFALGAFSIGTFTPVSREADYKLDLSPISNPISATSSAQPIEPQRLKAIITETAAGIDDLTLPKLSKLDDLILDAEEDGYLELLTIKLPSGETEQSPEKAAPILAEQLKSINDHTNLTANHSDSVSLDILQNSTNAADVILKPEQDALNQGILPEQEASVEAAPIAGPNLSLKQTAAPEAVAASSIRELKIKSGDTLTRIFSNANLPISQAITLSKNESAGKLNRLSIGKTLRIYYDQNKQLKSLQYDIDKLNTLMVTVQGGEFDIYTHEKQVKYRTFTAQGTIESSLSIATEIAGMSAGLSGDLIDIYKWEIDFARDLQQGDHFSVIYQKAFAEDQYIANGPILAASFTTGGRTIEAIRYTDSNDVTAYFQPSGESLRRGFLRSPVSLARVTSGFGKRLHPIKKTWKAHKGVDYGAKRGAPIVATADGVVQYAGKKGGYGNAVILRHGGIYTTLYAHMSKIGKGVRSGKSVAQGQVIGYVGKSGWATGNHLHYEFRVNGQHKDPLKVKLPKTLPLAKQEKDSFSKQANTLLATLASLDGTRVAKLAPKPGESAL